jgi:hypothetical protein
MRLFPTRSLTFLSAVSLIFSCNQYRHMQKIQSDRTCVEKFKPDFHHAEYKTSVEVIGKHLSGILLIKYMPDSSTRIVFTNETGFSFFDFAFYGDTGFSVYHIVSQMNKPALIKTLRKDFELIMFRNMDRSKSYNLADSGYIYHAYPQIKGVNYYITDDQCRQLVKMQRSSNKKPIMEASIYKSSPGNPPDSIYIRHLNFNFSISLKKITPFAAQ